MSDKKKLFIRGSIHEQYNPVDEKNHFPKEIVVIQNCTQWKLTSLDIERWGVSNWKVYKKNSNFYYIEIDDFCDISGQVLTSGCDILIEKSSSIWSNAAKIEGEKLKYHNDSDCKVKFPFHGQLKKMVAVYCDNDNSGIAKFTHVSVNISGYGFSMNTLKYIVLNNPIQFDPSQMTEENMNALNENLEKLRKHGIQF